MGRLANKRILLIIGGGIAAYKALELARRLMDEGASVRGVLTDGGAQFITPLSVAGLTGDQCFTSLFDLKDEAEMGHIRLSREADLLLVAPATADLMAKMAGGLANDLASTVLLATDKPVMVAPSMNAQMWAHPATQRNIATLAGDGIAFVGPEAGDLACGEVGKGRLADVPDIVNAVVSHFDTGTKSAEQDLTGRHVVITAGPTHEPIDPVRYIANRSSGLQGYEIARAVRDRGAKVTLVSGPTQLIPPTGIDVVQIETARQMADAVEQALPADVAICVAAVADWRVASEANAKLKKTVDGLPALDLVENPDILKAVSNHKSARPRLVVGFAAETDTVVAYASAKRDRKGCDWIVANDVSPETGVMGGRENTVILITADGPEEWAKTDKASVANKLAERIAGRFAT